MKIPFTGYVHGNKESGWDMADEIERENDLTLTDDQKKEIAYSFYEVTLKCEFDTETGKVTLVEAKL